MTKTAAELIASKKHILLDFDGPICAAFAGYGAAKISQQLAAVILRRGTPIADELFASSDPFQLLRYAALGGPELLSEVDTEFRRLECLAVSVAQPTPGALKVVGELASEGHTISVVSNNSTEAVTAYLQAHGLSPHVSIVSGREQTDPDLLKPSPYLIYQALRELSALPASAVMVGDSPSDIDAARSAGTGVVAYANKPGKLESLRRRHPEAIITDLNQLLRPDELG